MTDKKIKLLPVLLLFISFIMLCLAFVYYDFSNQIKNYKYSDKEEYDTVTEGLSFIENMPIHFNIINKYFSNMNNLSKKEKEEILMAYAIKNNYKLYNCGASTNTKSYLCINKSDLENSLFEDRFNLKLKFKNNNIDIYIDDYGMYKATSNNDSSYYKLTLDTSNNNNYRLYSIFDKYKKTDDTDVFYLYQGYL